MYLKMVKMLDFMLCIFYTIKWYFSRKNVSFSFALTRPGILSEVISKLFGIILPHGKMELDQVISLHFIQPPNSVTTTVHET